MAVFFCGCKQRSTDAPATVGFRLEVDDMIKDEAVRLVSLKVFLMQPAKLWFGEGDSGVGGELLMPNADKLRERKVVLIASRVVDSHSTNTLIQVSLRSKAEGGDGGLLVEGSKWSGVTAAYPVSTNTKLDDFINVTTKSGDYPLDAPLEVGRIRGKPLTLTVRKIN